MMLSARRTVSDSAENIEAKSGGLLARTLSFVTATALFRTVCEYLLSSLIPVPYSKTERDHLRCFMFFQDCTE